jgi:hypothetical protein
MGIRQAGLRLLAVVVLFQSLLPSLSAPTTSPLVLEPEAGPNPWMNIEALPDAEQFRFAIMSDRNGGGRPDVFRDAIAKLNMLRPDFVMCVGDLIPGYTRDKKALNGMWEELLADLRTLKAPFFFTPGNHDLTNDLQTTEWHSRLGRTYYHFMFRDVLFLVVDAEAPGLTRLRKEEIDHFRGVIEEHKDARWTFVFLHPPLWLNDSEGFAQKNGYSLYWREFEALLKGRKHTVFAGHLHDYASYERNGQKYYMLATTGGGSGLRGVENYGEMDHITWVTVTREGPVLANLELKGIHGEDVRTEQVRWLEGSAARAVRVHNVALAGKAQVRTSLQLSNDSDLPMQLEIEFDPENRLKVEPESVEVTLDPKSTATSELRLDSKETAEAASPGPVVFTWSTRFAPAGRKPVTFGGRKAIGVETPNVCARSAAPITVDGRLAEWGKLPFTSSDSALLEDAPAKRRKRQDGDFRFATRYDDKYVYVAVQMTDKKVLTDPERRPWDQDGVDIRLDARPDPERSAGRGEAEGTNFVFVSISPGRANDRPTSFGVERLPAGSQIACVRTPKGYAAELALPVSYLNTKQKGSWQGFRLNVAANDYHRADWRDPVRLTWRPDWRSELNYPGSGTFVRK